MNRRHKKKQQTDYLALIQDKWRSIDWQSYLDKVKSLWGQLPKFHQKALIVLVPVVVIIAVIPFPNMADSEVEQPANKRVALDINTSSLSEQKSTTKQSSALERNAWHEYTVQKGDTLSQVFRVNDLPMADLNALVKIEGSDKPLSHIQQGQLIRFKMAEEGKLDILQLEKNGQSVMFFRLSEGGFGRSK